MNHTPAQIQQFIEIVKAATPGTWRMIVNTSGSGYFIVDEHGTTIAEIPYGDLAACRYGKHIANFSPDTLARLLEDLAELQGIVDRQPPPSNQPQEPVMSQNTKRSNTDPRLSKTATYSDDELDVIAKDIAQRVLQGITHTRINLAEYSAMIDQARAANELLRAAQLQEQSETEHANCMNCESECEAEACELCFPLADKARLARRAAISTAIGESYP